MSDMKCPRCNEELKKTYLYRQNGEWYCDKCRSFGDASLWQELIRTRKALDVAKDVLKYANKCIKGGCVNWETEIDKALEQITALEQKDVK